jgi:LDH2 family malate/lactate/ureidoglycolate dehydrogenase
MTTTIVKADQLKTVCHRVLEHLGIPEGDAVFVAETLLQADLRGIHSHGSMRLRRYVRELRENITNPAPQIRVLEEGPGFARVDGDGALGQLVGRFAMEQCIAKAQVAGSATTTACRSRHFGAAGFFAGMALERDLIGISMTVASPRLAPTGGKVPLFGNNPIAVAVPGECDFPLILDIAVGSLAAGKLELAAAADKPIPAGVARDIDGNPTTDPALALKGSITPIGDHKGFGLTFVIEILAGLLAGSPYFGIQRDDVAKHVSEKGIGHFFMVLDPGRFMPLTQFKRAVGEMVEQTKASHRLPGVEEIYLPGEIDERLKRERLELGIPLANATVEMLRELGRECGVDLKVQA